MKSKRLQYIFQGKFSHIPIIENLFKKNILNLNLATSLTTF